MEGTTRTTDTSDTELAKSLVRFGVSVEKELLDAFDLMLARKGYTNRSEAIRDLMRDSLASFQAADDEAAVVGAITLLYDHHVPGVTERLIEAQHAYGSEVMSTVHSHLDHANCLEVCLVRGNAGRVKDIAGRLIGARGVTHGGLSLIVPAPAGGPTANHEPGHGHPHPESDHRHPAGDRPER